MRKSTNKKASVIPFPVQRLSDPESFIDESGNMDIVSWLTANGKATFHYNQTTGEAQIADLDGRLMFMITKPSTEKEKRLDELKRRSMELREIEDAIYEEAMSITGEEESNGHTQDFLNNAPDMTAAELLANMESNPSHLWDTSDA